MCSIDKALSRSDWSWVRGLWHHPHIVGYSASSSLGVVPFSASLANARTSWRVYISSPADRPLVSNPFSILYSLAILDKLCNLPGQHHTHRKAALTILKLLPHVGFFVFFLNLMCCVLESRCSGAHHRYPYKARSRRPLQLVLTWIHRRCCEGAAPLGCVFLLTLGGPHSKRISEGGLRGALLSWWKGVELMISCYTGGLHNLQKRCEGGSLKQTWYTWKQFDKYVRGYFSARNGHWTAGFMQQGFTECEGKCEPYSSYSPVRLSSSPPACLISTPYNISLLLNFHGNLTLPNIYVEY